MLFRLFVSFFALLLTKTSISYSFSNDGWIEDGVYSGIWQVGETRDRIIYTVEHSGRQVSVIVHAGTTKYKWKYDEVSVINGDIVTLHKEFENGDIRTELIKISPDRNGWEAEYLLNKKPWGKILVVRQTSELNGSVGAK